MASPVRSEDEYGQKVDRCLYNGLVKFGGGMAVGIVCSFLLFKRKPWPLLLGSGLGIGMAVSDCNHEFRGVARKAPIEGTDGLQYMSQQKGRFGFFGSKGDAPKNETNEAEACVDCRPLRARELEKQGKL